MSNKSTNNFFYRMLCGAFLGISVIAPGISGSIMAVMMGIYDDLITIISNPFKNIKKNFIYLLPMGIGAVVCILSLIHALDFAKDNYPVPTYLLFLSLIAGSVPTIVDEAKQEPIKKRYFIGTILAFAFALAIGFLAELNTANQLTASSTTGIVMGLYLPACGFISGMMSMLPGMSITMLLMMFCVYDHLIDVAKNILTFDLWFSKAWFSDVFTACSVAIAFVVGMVLFSNITKRVLKKYHSFSFLAIIGFMLGSIASIFITKVLSSLPHDALNWVICIIAIVVGLAVSYLFKVLGKKFNINE